MLILLFACAGPDPRFAGYADALAAYDRGRAALDAGRAADAATAFHEASTRDPESATLRIWEAKALVEAGRPDEADARITEVLQADPRSGTAWYQRAAWRARAGRMEEAASDLREALRLGVRSPLEAAADPDFQAALAHPAFVGVLPAAPVEASIRGTETIFVGSTYILELTLAHLPGAALTVERAGDTPACLRLSRIVQDDRPEPGKVTSVITIEAQATAGCTASLGPFTVRAGAASASLSAVPVVVEAPPGAPPATAELPTVFPVPSSLSPADSTPMATRVGGGVVAMAGPERTLVAGDRAPDVRLEWRVEAQTRATGGWWFGEAPLTVGDGVWSATVP